MERIDEEKADAQESARGGTRATRRPGAQRGQKARQPRKWSQGRYGQKPQEDYRRQAQCPMSTTATAQENVSAGIASIRTRFGHFVVGLGYGGIRYSAPVLR